MSKERLKPTHTGTLSEDAAKRIGYPELAGKTVQFTKIQLEDGEFAGNLFCEGRAVYASHVSIGPEGIVEH